MYFRRKAYDRLLEWKEKYADRYGLLLEGARRVGKTTIARRFAESEYRSYIFIDFAHASSGVLDCFEDIADLDTFFLRLQTECGVRLYPHESLIVFDEVQLFPRARQAIKYLVADGRYHYLETGSLISIRKNTEHILLPSEEMKLRICPMDYEEFMLASGNETYDILKEICRSRKSAGQVVNRTMMRRFRTYMAVGGMPQAVEAYLQYNNFQDVDRIKREIITLYEDDFRKIDTSGKVGMIYRSVPAQLARGTKKFALTSVVGGTRSSAVNNRRIFHILDSWTVTAAYNTTSPGVSLEQTRDIDTYKLYTADTGLFVTLMFLDRPVLENDIYAKLLSDKLPANLGYLYENAVAQAITAADRGLYYHTWKKKDSTHNYEIDFLLSDKARVIPVEVKSSGTGRHESLTAFQKKYSRYTGTPLLVSQKDISAEAGYDNLPVYLFPAYLSLLAEG